MTRTVRRVSCTGVGGDGVVRDAFVMEYVGEVLDYEEFVRRTLRSRDHFYFMALSGDEILDASRKGNVSRFINHSCEPNCETQKVRPPARPRPARPPTFAPTSRVVFT